MNINAINDSIKAAFSITNKTVISVMRGNAGAGGAMAAMSSDIVWAHKNVILNPHYKVLHTFLPIDYFFKGVLTARPSIGEVKLKHTGKHSWSAKKRIDPQVEYSLVCVHNISCCCQRFYWGALNTLP